MKFINLLNITILILQSAILFAQYSSKAEILKDDSIPWAGEFELDIIPDFRIDEEDLVLYEIEGKNRVRTLKIRNTKTKQFYFEDEDLQLNYTLKRKWDNIPLYKDAALTQSFSKKEAYDLIHYYDTVIFYDPEIYREEEKIVAIPFHLDAISVFRLKAIIYYDPSYMDYKVIPQAIGIVHSPFNKDKTAILSKKILAWIPIAEWINKVNLDNKNITWAKHIRRDLYFKDIKIFKETANTPTVFQQFIDDIETKTPPLYNYFGELLNDDEVKSISTSIDTVLTFHAETFTKSEEFIINKLNIEHIEGFQLILGWAWDDKKYQLLMHQVGFSPLINMYDENGKFKYRTLFFTKLSEKSNE